MYPKTYMQLQDKFGGKFIARHNNRIIASAPTMKGLFIRLKKEHISSKGIVIGHIPERGHICVY